MKKNGVHIVFTVFIIVVSLSAVALASSEGFFINRISDDYTQDENVVADAKAAYEKVNEEILDTVKIDNEKFHKASLDKLPGKENISKVDNVNEADKSAFLAKLKDKWVITAVGQIIYDAPVGSTYPLIYISSDQKQLVVLYKEADGTIVQKAATYKAPKDEKSLNFYEMFDVSEHRYNGEPLPEILQLQ